MNIYPSSIRKPKFLKGKFIWDIYWTVFRGLDLKALNKVRGVEKEN